MNKILVLAAGKGKRMESDLPKVVVPIDNKPMIQYLMDSILKSKADSQPIIIVSPDNIEIIRQALKDYNCKYALQNEQLGTGHAVQCAKGYIDNIIENVAVFYGDHPFISAETIRKLIASHTEKSAKVTMMTTIVDDFEDWRKNFLFWGRIIRENGKVSKIVEYRDAKENEKEIKEINPALYCFNKEWLFDNINKLKNNNKQKEYYLTDLIKIAFDQGLEINDVHIAPHESIGANSKEELEIAKRIYKDIIK